MKVERAPKGVCPQLTHLCHGTTVDGGENRSALFCFSFCYVAQAGLELEILLCLLPECRDYRCAPPPPATMCTVST
jgi:hypothetical protein